MAHIYNSQLDAYTLYHQQQEALHRDPKPIGPVLPALGHALSGSTGTAISNLALYPLDLVVTRLQVQKQLLKKQKLQASPSKVDTVGAAQSSTLEESISSNDVDEYTGLIDAFIKIYQREGGIAAFYTGVAQDTAKSIIDSFLFFLFYNFLRTNRLQKHGAKTTTLPVIDELAVGALAGAGSKFFTTPISNVVTRLQIASMIKSSSSSPSQTREQPTSVRAIARSIHRSKGLKGFWSGYSAALVLTLNPSLTFFLYETFKRLLLPRARRDNPGAKTTFLLAAISKAITSSITYPFTAAKARAQTESQGEEDSDTAELGGKDSSGVEKAKAQARRRTVFAIIAHVYATEGLGALYDGVGGEILKGFFSNGVTMLVKERIHGAIIKFYFALLRLLPAVGGVRDSPSSMAVIAKGTNPAATGDVRGSNASIAGAGSGGDGEISNGIIAAVVNAVAVGYANARAFASNASDFVKEGNEVLADEVGDYLEDTDTVSDVVGEVGGIMQAGMAKVKEEFE